MPRGDGHQIGVRLARAVPELAGVIGDRRDPVLGGCLDRGCDRGQRVGRAAQVIDDLALELFELLSEGGAYAIRLPALIGPLSRGRPAHIAA